MPGVPAFTATEYDQVRAAMDLRLTADMVPDSVIAQAIFEGQGRAIIDSNVEEAIITANTDKATMAAVLYTAALMLPSLPHVLKEDIPGGTQQFSDRNLLNIAEQRRAEAGALLAALQALQSIDPSPVSVPVVFTVGDAPCR